VYHQDFIEQRRHRRFKVRDEIVVLFSFPDLCLPTDFSAGGLAVKSRGYDTRLIPRQWSIDILLKEESFHAQIPLKLAWKKNTDHSYFPNLFGFQFDKLTETNRSKVEYLVKLHQELEYYYDM